MNKVDKRKKHTPPACRKLGSITELTKRKRPGASDGRKSKI